MKGFSCPSLAGAIKMKLWALNSLINSSVPPRVFRGLNAELLINLRCHSRFSLLRHIHASCVFLYFCAVEVLYCSHLCKDNWVLSSWGRAWLETWQSKWWEEPACLFTSPLVLRLKSILGTADNARSRRPGRMLQLIRPHPGQSLEDLGWQLITAVPVTRLRTVEASLDLKNHPLVMIHGALFCVEAAFWSSGDVEMLEHAKEKKWGDRGGAHLINH